MSSYSKLLIPAIRWDADRGYEGEREHIDMSIDVGCGGYILFGGESSAVKELTAELRERSGFPLLIASDLERGAGQQFAGATGLPPLAALGDRFARETRGSIASRAGRLTAKDALAHGVNWVLAPVCDVDAEAKNPIVGTRAAASEPDAVASFVAEWIDGCQAAGAMACGKHFPGHGRTTVDSHAALPAVSADLNTLLATDLVPFRAALDAGVSSILTAHVSFPALDPTGAPATLSRPILRDLLRTRMKFGGIIVTDAMIMDGVLRWTGGSESAACVAALDAGCDLVLYPSNVAAVAIAVDAAVREGRLNSDEAARSLERRDYWARWATTDAAPISAADAQWADSLALSCVTSIRGEAVAIPGALDVLVVDDDVGGPYAAPSREPFFNTLAASGFDVRRVEVPVAREGALLIVALFGDIRSWKGRPGYSAESLGAVGGALARESAALVMQFSHPRLTSELPVSAARVVCAWGGERTMQRAAATWLASRAGKG